MKHWESGAKFLYDVSKGAVLIGVGGIATERMVAYVFCFTLALALTAFLSANHIERFKLWTSSTSPSP